MEIRKDEPTGDKILLASYEHWKKRQKSNPAKNCIFNTSLKKERNKKKTNKRKLKSDEGKEGGDDIKQGLKVQRLPDTFLEELTKPSSVNSTTKKIKSKNKRKKKLTITSALVDEAGYIPLEINSNTNSTNFKLFRLDKQNSSSATQAAIEFYNRKLHGKHIQRVPIKSIRNGMEKIKAKRKLGKQRK